MPPPIKALMDAAPGEHRTPATFRPVFGDRPATCILCAVGGSSWSVRSGRFDPESQGHPFHGYELCPKNTWLLS